MTPEEEKVELNKLAPAAINEVLGSIEGNFAGFQKAREDYLSQLPVGDPRFFEPALTPADFLSEEGLKQRGLLDEKGEATQLGEDYLLMEDQGFMDNGKLTEKGIAYTANPDELLPVNDVNDWTLFTNTFDLDKDTGLPSDPEVLRKFRLFQIRKKDGLDEVEGEGVFKQLGKGLLSVGRGLYDVSQPRVMMDIVTGKGISPSNELTKVGALVSGVTNVMADTTVKSIRFAGIPLERDQEEKDLNDFIVATRVKINQIASEPEALDAITGTSVMADAYTKTLENYKERFGEAGESKLQQDLIDIKTVGQVAGDPLNVPLAIATSGVGLLGKFAMVSRVAKSVDVANKTSTQIARLNAAAPKIAEELSRAKLLNKALVKQLDDAVKVGDSATVAKLTPAVANSTKVVDDLTRTAAQMEEGLALNQSVRTKALTDLANKSKPLDLSRKATAAGVKGVEVAAEKMGNTVAFADRGLRAAERFMGRYHTGRIITSTLGAGSMIANPVASGTAMISYVAARTGLYVAPKILHKTAKFANAVGDELVQMKNSTPFWRRVAANENVGGIGKAMATTLDYASPAARFAVGSVKQGVKIAPAVAVYEAINNAGLDDEAMKRVGANALVFGAFARVVGGGKQDLAKRQTGDFYNYRAKQKNLGEDKLAAFDSIPDQNLKQFVATYDSAYPNTWDWQFTREGNSSFDPSSRTITVNVNDKSGFVRALTAHETLHSLTFKHGMDDSIVAKMLGDETRPGLVRDINGNLDKDFRQFYEAYNERLDAQGLPRIGLEDAAVEFFTDNGTAALFDDVVSGKLTKAAVKTPLRRKIEDIFDTVFAATPIVKDLHYKLGGATDVNGNLVMGSGLLADGMKELPEVKAMIRKMYRESAGLPKSPIRPNLAEDAPSSNPKHYKAAEIIDEINKKNVKEGKPLIEDVMIPDKNGNGTGKLSDDHLAALEEGDIIKQGGALELAHIQSTFDKNMAGLIDYTPIEQGRSVQTAGKTTNKIKPINFMLKDGRLYLVGMDIVQLGLNIQRLERKAATMGMSRANVLTDIAETAKLHKRGVSTDGYFKSVGGKDWKKRKNLINAIQGLNTKAQRLTNPMFDKLGMDKQTGTYRTFAYDRIDGFTDLTGDMVIPYGNNAYYTLKANLMPQAPRINVKGEIVKDAADVRLMPERKPNPNVVTQFLKEEVPISKVPFGSILEKKISNGEISSVDISFGLGGKNTVVEATSLFDMMPSGTNPNASVYHQTTISSAKSILMKITGANTRNLIYVAPNLDLALGQKGSGVIIEFNPNKVQGVRASGIKGQISEVTGFPVEYVVNKVGVGAVDSIIFESAAKLDQFRKSLKPGIESRFNFESPKEIELGVTNNGKKGLQVNRTENSSKTIRLMPEGNSKANPTNPLQKNTPKKRNLDNSVATGIAVALGSSGEKRNE
jgi:hypothetical protein